MLSLHPGNKDELLLMVHTLQHLAETIQGAMWAAAVIVLLLEINADRPRHS